MIYPIPYPQCIRPALANNPIVLYTQLFQGVYASNATATPVDPRAVPDAEDTVKVLFPCSQQVTYCLGNLPDVITDPIIETAKKLTYFLKETRELLLSFDFV